MNYIFSLGNDNSIVPIEIGSKYLPNAENKAGIINHINIS